MANDNQQFNDNSTVSGNQAWITSAIGSTSTAVARAADLSAFDAMTGKNAHFFDR